MDGHDTSNGDGAIQRRLEFPRGFDSGAFFTTGDGRETLTGPSDLEATVPTEEKGHLVFEDQYWTNEPYAFVSVWRNERHEEYRYYIVEPTLSSTERKLLDFLRDKLRFAIDYDDHPTDVTRRRQEEIVGSAAVTLLDRFNLLERGDVEGISSGLLATVREWVTSLIESRATEGVDAATRPELSTARDSVSLSDAQVKRLLYYLRRDYVWYGPIDPIKRDVHVEDISCDGYDSPVFVYHTDRGEQIVTNRTFGREGIDEFVVNMAQRAGTGISRREPNVNATLPDGSRAQLTLGSEISDHGTNFTIRQFKDVPFTPLDLLHWGTFSLDALAYMWLAIENHKSAIFAGGTASGKTTTLNAMSLFMPATEKIVSIEDTRELEIPQRNWVASTTRDGYGDGGDIDEFDLLKDALRQRPDYIVVGEVRGEEGRDLLQTMNTGHTTYTTFHAGETLEVIRRFTEEPIDASKSMFEGVDLVCNQASVTVDGTHQRRITAVEEVESYDAGTDTFSVTDAFTYDPEADAIRTEHTHSSPVLEDIKRRHGWSDADLRGELTRRKLVLAYLSDRSITSYAGVAATLQAYMTTPTTVLTRMAEDALDERIDNLRSMRTIDIDVDEETEALVPRPTLSNASQRTREAVAETLSEGERVLDQYRDASVALGADDGPPGQVGDGSVERDVDGPSGRDTGDPSGPSADPEPASGGHDSGDATAGETPLVTGPGVETGPPAGEDSTEHRAEDTDCDSEQEGQSDGDASDDDDDTKGLDALLE